MRHGTRWCYYNGCRCAECVASNRDYVRRFKAQRIASGRCVECSAPAMTNRQRCRTHAIKHAATCAAWRMTRKAAMTT